MVEAAMPIDIHDVEDLVRRQEQWRGRETINLIASENAQSRAVREVQNSDFMARYAEAIRTRGILRVCGSEFRR